MIQCIHSMYIILKRSKNKFNNSISLTTTFSSSGSDGISPVAPMTARASSRELQLHNRLCRFKVDMTTEDKAGCWESLETQLILGAHILQQSVNNLTSSDLEEMPKRHKIGAGFVSARVVFVSVRVLFLGGWILKFLGALFFERWCHVFGRWCHVFEFCVVFLGGGLGNHQKININPT